MEVIKISERELRDIIRESVYRILDEVRGALDERMRGLAETIWNRIEGGETDFVIDTRTIDKCQDYFKATKPIEVKTCKERGVDYKTTLKASIIPFDDKYVLEINLYYVGISLEPIPIIMHEFVHMVNIERYKLKQVMETADANANLYLYYFRDTECNARVGEFSEYLTGKLQKNEAINSDLYCEEYEAIHRLKEMYNLLNIINITDSYTYPNCIIAIASEKGRLPTSINQLIGEFDQIKGKILREGWKIFNRYSEKIQKILRYALGKFNNKGTN